jgi:hypothetical protein
LEESRRSSGRRAMAVMVEQLVPLLDISRVRGTRRSSGWWATAAMVEWSLSGEEPGRSAAASKESSEKTTSGAEEKEVCKREKA